MDSVTFIQARQRPPGKIFKLKNCVTKAPSHHSCHRGLKKGQFAWWPRPIIPATREVKAGALQLQDQPNNEVRLALNKKGI